MNQNGDSVEPPSSVKLVWYVRLETLAARGTAAITTAITAATATIITTATAAATAITTTATTAAVTAAAITTATTAATTWAIFAGTGFVNGQGTVVHRIAIEAADSFLTAFFSLHFDETETFGAACFTIRDHRYAVHFTSLREKFL
jgi:hypothetical protein